MKKAFTAFTILLASLCLFGCKSAKEKCEDGDLNACKEVLEEASKELDEQLDKASKELDKATEELNEKLDKLKDLNK